MKIIVKAFAKGNIFVLLFCAILVVSANISNAQKLNIQRPEAYFAPDTNFFDENGEKVFLDQFEGKTILLVFWATWCGSCVSEIPSLDILQKDFRKLPFEVIALSQDYLGVEAIKKHFAEKEIRHLKIYHDFKNQLFKSMEVIGLPSAYIIDPDGKIKIILRGAVKWHDAEIRDIILSEIPGNLDVPKNTYIENTLNQKVTPQPAANKTKENKNNTNEEKNVNIAK